MLVYSVLELSKAPRLTEEKLEVQTEDLTSRNQVSMEKGVLEMYGQNYLNEYNLLGLKEKKCLYYKFAGGGLGILPGLCQMLELTYSFHRCSLWQKDITGSCQMLIFPTVKRVNDFGKSQASELE